MHVCIRSYRTCSNLHIIDIGFAYGIIFNVYTLTRTRPTNLHRVFEEALRCDFPCSAKTISTCSIEINAIICVLSARISRSSHCCGMTSTATRHNKCLVSNFTHSHPHVSSQVRKMWKSLYNAERRYSCKRVYSTNLKCNYIIHQHHQRVQKHIRTHETL